MLRILRHSTGEESGDMAKAPGSRTSPGPSVFGHRHRTAGARVPGKTSEYPDGFIVTSKPQSSHVHKGNSDESHVTFS